MEINTKIKLYGLFPITKKQFIIIYSFFGLTFITLTIIFSFYQVPYEHIENALYRLISKHFNLFWVLMILMLAWEAQFYWTKFVRAQLLIIQKQKVEIEEHLETISEQNEELKQQKEEILTQKEEIESQRDRLYKQNKNITDSITYASRIQKAVLPQENFISESLPEHFILFRPRDIVSGDFYWMDKKNGKTIVVAADCTGHGVPGAFMSMLGISFLNDIVHKMDDLNAGEILNQMRRRVKSSLHQSGKDNEAKDGMDIALLVIDQEKNKVQYAGAYNPLYLLRPENSSNTLIEKKADRMPIGIYMKEKESFTSHEIEIKRGDSLYCFSDGYMDQLGGPERKKFLSKNFKALITKHAHQSMAEQKRILESTLDKWQENTEQVDDILVLGVRV